MCIDVCIVTLATVFKMTSQRTINYVVICWRYLAIRFHFITVWRGIKAESANSEMIFEFCVSWLLLLDIFTVSNTGFFLQHTLYIYIHYIYTWLIEYLLLYIPLENISLIWRRHHCWRRAANLGLCSALRAFEQGGIFFVPHLLRHGTSIFPVSSEWAPHSVAFYDTQGDAEDLF